MHRNLLERKEGVENGCWVETRMFSAPVRFYYCQRVYSLYWEIVPLIIYHIKLNVQDKNYSNETNRK